MRYFWGLDLIRFISAVMVVLFHFGGFGGVRPAWPVAPEVAPMGWLQPYSWMGWIGVQIFFVLSGFVIAASARNAGWSEFLVKRGIRLLPALWIAASLSLVARLLWGEAPADLIPAFLKTLVLSPKGPYIDGVVWTLVVETAFYCGVALVILLAPKLGGNEKALNSFALLIGAFSSAFTLLYWLATGWLSAHGANEIKGVLDSFLFDFTLMRQGVFFALGMMLFHAIERGLSSRNLPIIFILSLFCCLQIHNNVGAERASTAPILIWLIATALVYLGARFGNQLIKRDVRSIMRPIGLMTYPLYLNHFVLGAALLPLLTSVIDSSGLVFALLFGILLANAWFMAQYPERWIQNRLKSLLKSRTAPTAVRHEPALA